MSETQPGQQGGQAAEEPTAFDVIGGAPRLKALVDRFYALMDSEPEFAVIRQLHPADLAGSNEKLYFFLTGWLGGPPLYAHKYGHPMLRARHLPYAIGSTERDQWMACMSRAMADTGIDGELGDALRDALSKTADWMRNKAGDSPQF